MRSPASEAPGPWVGWIDNGDDPPATVNYLRALGVYRPQPLALADFAPVVVRPTPGGGDRTALGFDLLTALGKSPHVLRDERLRLRGHEIWDCARAWLAGSAITDLIIDRAHQLSTDMLSALTGVATDAAVTPWMIWSSPDDEAAALAAKSLTMAGYHVERMPVATMRQVLPDPSRALALPPASAFAGPWPILPTADFTTFRAACRRNFARAAFTRIDEVYRAARDRTDEWMEHLHHLHSGDLPLLPPALTDVAYPLLGWLRDVQLGPTPDAGTALITLRATQAALFGHAILLRWTPDALGPDPAGRLPGNLTPAVAAALSAGARTNAAAATVLSLHLNLAPTRLHCFLIGGVAADGSYLAPPPISAQHTHGLANAALSADSPSGIGERACAGPIAIPALARPIIAAHLAYRRAHGADDDDPYFVHSLDPRREPTATMREAAIRICRRLHLNPPWLHRDPCKYGADVALNRRTQGWLVERGLSLAQLDRYAAARRPAYRYPLTCHE